MYVFPLSIYKYKIEEMEQADHGLIVEKIISYIRKKTRQNQPAECTLDEFFNSLCELDQKSFKFARSGLYQKQLHRRL